MHIVTVLRIVMRQTLFFLLLFPIVARPHICTILYCIVRKTTIQVKRPVRGKASLFSSLPHTAPIESLRQILESQRA